MTNIEIIEGFDKENYGSYALKKSYHHNLIIGLIFGIMFHLTALMVYYVSSAMIKYQKKAEVFEGNNIWQPIPLDKTLQPPINVQADTREIRPVTGDAIITPDVDVNPDITLQTQEDIKIDVNPMNFKDVGSIEIKIDDPLIGLGSDDPDMNAGRAVDQEPVALTKVLPIYPEIAKQAGLEGRVFVKGLIDENGNVVKAVVISGDEIFRQAAVDALLRTKFKPAINGNRPVKVWITYPFKFTLKN